MASTIRNMSKPLPPSRTAPQFVIRFPDDELRDRIKQAAEANNRSMNAEIIARLQESFDWLTIEGRPVHRDGIELVETDKLEKIVTKVAERAATEYRLALAEALRSLPPTADRTTLVKNLAIEPDHSHDNEKTSRTPAIPGVNAPKRGLGATPRPDKPSKPKKQTMVKKRVFVDTPPDTTKK